MGQPRTRKRLNNTVHLPHRTTPSRQGAITGLHNIEKQTAKQNEEAGEHVSTEGTRQNPRKKLNETDVSSLSDKEVKVMVIKMLTKLGRL